MCPSENIASIQILTVEKVLLYEIYHTGQAKQPFKERQDLL